MSQKAVKRSTRRATSDSDTTPITKPSQTNGTNDTEEKRLNKSKELDTNGTELNGGADKTEHKEIERDSPTTRSRSKTPQRKSDEEVATNSDKLEKVTEENENSVKSAEECPISDVKENKTEETELTKKEENAPDVQNGECEMDALVLSDEPDPELMFEENSDLESGTDSPVSSRCKTRRSQSRNIPTPKTPKLLEGPSADTPVQPESSTATNLLDNIADNTSDSCVDALSTKAQAGNDSTRLEFTDSPSSFLANAKNHSFGETLRHLSTRRTIRPISENYRKKALKGNLGKSDLDGPSYPVRRSVERVSLGRKRKNSSESLDQQENFKKHKGDSPRFFSLLMSPLTNIRNPFSRTDIPSSTPKLTGYKEGNLLLEGGDDFERGAEIYESEPVEEKRWCSIM